MMIDLRELFKRWIKAGTTNRSTSRIKNFPLPKGEGQGEGKSRLITKRRAI